ncbi:MAG TPA: MmcQ/YjbR family DNA-binding protein [Caulobacteraceae bacterium]
MTPEALDAFCRALPGATGQIQWQTDQVYKVGGKMFAVVGPGGTVSFKVNDIAFEMLVETGAARPAPYLARAKWVLLDDLSSFGEADLRSYLTEAHRIVAAKLPRKLRAGLGLAPGSDRRFSAEG